MVKAGCDACHVITDRTGNLPGEDRTMRIAVGGYLVSANTFATQRISLERFQRSVISGDDLLNRLGRGDSAIAGFLSGARDSNWEVAPLHFMFPGLAGKVHGQAHQ